MKLLLEDVAHHFQRPLTVNEHGCWLWYGSLDRHGYARFGEALVYGVVYRMAGRICPPDKELCHSCASKNCVNPDHIYEGTHQQNMIDAKLHGPRKLTQEDIETVNRLLKTTMTYADICKTVGVSPQWMTKFLNGGFKYAKPRQASVK